MRDPWKYVAFPAAAVSGYLISIAVQSVSLGAQLGIPDIAANLLVIAISGLVAGFMVDEVIPAYLEKVREGRGGGDDFGGGDFGEDGGFDDGGADFGE